MGNSSDVSTEVRKYDEGPPWVFAGRALYQIHVVKTEVARRFIPPELKIVEAFGYTLGGLFLARYDSSPAGAFDEAVVITGIVWNPPTSCAWAGRVLVNSEEARLHGRKEVGLPSHLAQFSHSQTAPSQENGSPWCHLRSKLPFWRSTRWGVQRFTKIEQNDFGLVTPLCQIARVPEALMKTSTDSLYRRWSAPSVQLSLPSFSGKTLQQPSLLKYSCILNCKIKMVSPAIVSSLIDLNEDGKVNDAGVSNRDVVAVLTGKPLTALLFDQMVMRVGAPSKLFVKIDHKETKEVVATSAPAATV